MSSISTVKNINHLRRVGVATKNTAVALPRTITAMKVTGILAGVVAVEAAQGKTRNLQSSMSMSLKTDHITTNKNGIDEAAGFEMIDIEMEPIRLEDVADEGALITSDDEEPISILSVFDENASPDDVISIIMKATGVDDDADMKERIMASMPSEKTFHSLSPEKKCKLFRFVFGHSYFHGLFHDFLEKVCPQAPKPTTTGATEVSSTLATEPSSTLATEPSTTRATEPATTTEASTTGATDPSTTRATEPATTTEASSTLATEPSTTSATDPATTTPFTCPVSPADFSVLQGGCCETDAQCSSKSTLLPPFLFYYITCFLFCS